jgi:hypothetical protein
LFEDLESLGLLKRLKGLKYFFSFEAFRALFFLAWTAPFAMNPSEVINCPSFYRKNGFYPMRTLPIQNVSLPEPISLREEVVAALKLVIAKIVHWVAVQWHRLCSFNPAPLISKWIFVGSQLGVVTGDVSITKAEEIRLKLEQRSPAGIRFNPGKIGSRLEGGACTAMSLEFAREYLRIRKECVQSRSILRRLSELGASFFRNGEELRNQQMAFNTIEVVGSEGDHSRNKIQALVNLHGFTIVRASQEADTRRMQSESDVEKMTQGLPEGTYLVRILKPANNEKLEKEGHSMVYVKEKEFGLFYDPNQGARELSADEHARVLFQSFKENLAAFEISQARFYLISPPLS